MKLLGVFFKQDRGESQCVFVCACVFLWQTCVMYVPDLAGPKLSLWSGQSSGLVKKKKKKPFSSEQYTDFGVFKIHCVFQHVGKN